MNVPSTKSLESATKQAEAVVAEDAERMSSGTFRQQRMTHRSEGRSWVYWAFHLKKTLRLDAQIVDQVRKRHQIDRDGHVDVPLTGPVFLPQLGLDLIEPSS
jgi:hypothetical protein